MLEYTSWFTKKTVLVPWRYLGYELEGGIVKLHDTRNPKASASMSLETTYNAEVFKFFVAYYEST